MDREEAIDILTQLKDFNEYNINRKGQHFIYIPKAEKMLINYAIDYILSELEENKKKIENLEKGINRLKNKNKKLSNKNINETVKLTLKRLSLFYISKQKVKEGLEDIEDYFDRLNGPDEDMEYIRNIKKKLLEDI